MLRCGAAVVFYFFEGLMARQLFYALFFVLLCAGSIQPMRAGSLLFVDGSGSNQVGNNDFLFTYNGSTLVNTSTNSPFMGNPGQIAVGADGNLYIPEQDIGNGSGIDIFSGTNGQFIGQYLASSFSNGLSFAPTGLAWGPDGKLYIGDSSGDFVSSYDGTTVSQAIGPNAGLFAPEGMTFGPGGFLYVANANSGVISRWDGTTLISSFTSVVDHGGAFFDVTVGIDGNLYVTDTTNSVVQVFRASDGTYLGHFGNTGTVLVQPTGLAFAPNGDLYVTDANGVQVFNNTGNFVNQLIQFDSNPGDQSMGQFLALSSTVPEPSAFLLSVLGLLGIGAVARWQRAR